MRAASDPGGALTRVSLNHLVWVLLRRPGMVAEVGLEAAVASAIGMAQVARLPPGIAGVRDR